LNYWSDADFRGWRGALARAARANAAIKARDRRGEARRRRIMAERNALALAMAKGGR